MSRRVARWVPPAGGGHFRCGRSAAKFSLGRPATVAELVDAQDLGSCGATRGGSSPSGRIADRPLYFGPLVCPISAPRCRKNTLLAGLLGGLDLRNLRS